MPPNDYAPYKSVVPNSGIATASPVTPVSTPEYTPEELAYLQEQRAAAEPWSSYLGSIASNLKNTAQGFLPTALGGRGDIGISDIATGAAQSAYSGATLPGDALAGKVQVFDPSTGRPTEEVMQRGADFTGLVTLGAGAIPAETNTLRMGLAVRPEEAHPNNPAGSLRKAEVRGGFFNRSEELLSEFGKKQTTVQEFKSYLENKGVKKAEMEALGLANLDPNEVISKDQIITNALRNEPRFTERSTKYFENETMPGGTNYRMLNVTLGNPDATYGMHPFRYGPHHLPDNTLFHARLKDDVYTGADGLAKKVLRVEELQSDWAQETAGQWALPATADRIEIKRVPLDKVESSMQELYAKRIKQNPSDGPKYNELARSMVQQAQKAGHDTVNFYRVKGVQDDKWQIMGSGEPFTPEEFLQEARDTFGETLKAEGNQAGPLDPMEEMLYNEQFGAAPAPYVTQGSAGWVPLATKKLLLEAAQNGQDEIVIAPGKVHANRWATNDPARAEGLETFYDSILPKEMGKVLKDVEKESGIKGLKITAEERPFVDHGTNLRYDDPAGSVLTWTEQGHANFDDYLPPQNYALPEDLEDAQLNANTLLRRVVHKMEVDSRSSDEAFTDLGHDLVLKKEVTLDQMESNNQIIADLESLPYDKITRDDEENLRRAYDRADQWETDLKDAEDKLALLPTVRQMYKDWESNVKAPPDADSKQAWVIKLSPDLREFILKNGLPRFAKGGIVDLVERAAYA